MSDLRSSSSSPSSSAALPQFPIELSDADATLEVHSIVPKATDTDTELGDEDVLAEDELSPEDLCDEEPAVIVAAETAPRARPPLPRPSVPPFSRRSIPSHNSIGPIALDVPPPSYVRRADRTVLVPRVQGGPDTKRLLAFAAAAMMGVLGAASFCGVASYAASRASVAAAGGSAITRARGAAPKSKELAVTADELAVSVDPIPAPVAAIATPAPARASAPVSAPPAVTSAPPVRTSAPVAAAAAPRGPVGKTGTLRLPPSIHGMLVDGKPRRVEGGTTVLSCGKHAVKTGITPSRTVDVPCGGTAWL